MNQSLHASEAAASTDGIHHHEFEVRIDGHPVRFATAIQTGLALLESVHKPPCAFELIAEFAHRENDVVAPEESIDLTDKNLKGFITAHKENVTVFFGKTPYQISRGDHTVAEILGLAGKPSDGYTLYLEKSGGPPLPVPANQPVTVEGCEQFSYQVDSGGSS